MFKSIITALVLVITASSVSAGEFAKGIAVSKHVGFEQSYNEIHPFVSYTQDRVEVGAYLNSESTVSAYGLYEVYKKGDFSAQAGVVTGYSTAKVLPLVKLKFKNWFAAPAVEVNNGKTSLGVVFGLEFKF